MMKIFGNRNCHREPGNGFLRWLLRLPEEPEMRK